MHGVGERPGHGRRDERDAHQNEVQDGDGGEVAEPHPARVQPRRVGVRDGRDRHHLHGAVRARGASRERGAGLSSSEPETAMGGSEGGGVTGPREVKGRMAVAGDKRPAFGSRRLVDSTRVFEHNAW